MPIFATYEDRHGTTYKVNLDKVLYCSDDGITTIFEFGNDEKLVLLDDIWTLKSVAKTV